MKKREIFKSIILPIIFIATPCVLFGLFSMPTEMGIGITAGALLSFFVNLDKFDNFKAAGVEAKIKNVVEEANLTISKFEEESKKQFEKMIMIQNAMILSTSENYWASNECLRKLKVEYPDDLYIEIYIAVNSFRELGKSNNEVNKEKEESIYETINSFIGWYYKTEGKLADKLMIGDVFHGYTVHEVYLLIQILEKCESINISRYIKVCKKTIKYILDVIGIQKEEEIYDFDQTDSFVMIYKELNFSLCEMYKKTDNAQLKSQLTKTISLYKIDNFDSSNGKLEKCIQMLAELQQLDNIEVSIH